ncbi:hypothetical protein WR25_19253 [Diploscapter pachys]|uniref:Uncharacterized protein n=1 Tax=Diploscapter pachys TaxID=2018661 RepID=A0A2A2L7B5_9BILA|nr:hypothetical protein WR25_19253 [Diploscapter pachys]
MRISPKAAPVVYDIPPGSAACLSLPFDRFTSREAVNSHRMQRANQFSLEIDRLPKDLISSAHAYHQEFVVLSISPYTFCQQDEQRFLASPCEFAAVRFSLTSGVISRKVWHVRFDEEKMLGEGCRNVDGARECMAKFAHQFGHPIRHEKFDVLLLDADQVWKELLDFVAGRETMRVLYDVEQHNFVMPCLAFLSSLSDSDLSLLSSQLLPIQDAVAVFNAVFGLLEMHPFAIDRFFLKKLKLLNDNNCICPLHGPQGLAQLSRLCCCFVHTLRLIYLFDEFANEARFINFEAANLDAIRFPFVPVSFNVTYSVSAPFPLPTTTDLSRSQPPPEPTNDRGIPLDFWDYLFFVPRSSTFHQSDRPRPQVNFSKDSTSDSSRSWDCKQRRKGRNNRISSGDDEFGGISSAIELAKAELSTKVDNQKKKELQKIRIRPNELCSSARDSRDALGFGRREVDQRQPQSGTSSRDTDKLHNRLGIQNGDGDGFATNEKYSRPDSMKSVISADSIDKLDKDLS